VPVVLCGISWGGKLVAAVARVHAALLEAVVLICPGIYSPYVPSLLKRTILAMPVPVGIQQRRLKIPLFKPELFTNSSRWQKFISTDSLALRTIIWRFAQEDRHLTHFARKSASFIHCPILMMLAGQDRIVDNESTLKYFSRVAGSRKVLIEYPSAAHTLEFEQDPSLYFADLANWIKQVAQPSPNSVPAIQRGLILHEAN
jgi:acylglycerol lipase